MAKYSFKVVDSSGKSQKKTVEAKSEEAARVKLKSEGYSVAGVGKEVGGAKKKGGKVSDRDLSVFCKQFAAVLRAGVPIISALDMMGEQMTNKTLQSALADAGAYVQKGGTLADAMRQNPKAFPSMLANMVAAGESSGKLEIAFERMATQFEKDGAIKAKIKGAMTYPIVILVVVIGVVALLMVMVIPTFSEMFKEMGTQLPAATQALVNLSDFITKKWWLLLIIVGALIFGIKVFKGTPAGQQFFGQVALKAPIFGQLSVKTAAATFSRTFATLLASGIPLIDAVEQTGRVMKNKVIRDGVISCKAQVAKGVPLSKPIRDLDIFPTMLPSMMHIGEETGNIEEMMEKVADFYEEEVAIATDSLTSMMEPLIIVVLGVTVGGIVIAIYTPILSMYDAVDNY
ncbi:MAG: type II secretion system F family protein [Eubacterium sp.]|nr:type II secretion system F family protein [Eubacterium sp.]